MKQNERKKIAFDTMKIEIGHIFQEWISNVGYMKYFELVE